MSLVPFLFFLKASSRVYMSWTALVEAGGSINFAVKSQFFGKDRTDQLAFFDSRGFLVDFVELAQVVDRVVNKPFSSFYSGSASISWALFSKFCIQSKQTLH
jgi:hypothetical protein